LSDAVNGRIRLAARAAGRRLGRKEWFRRVARRFSKVPGDRTWAFVLGCYDSGTTLLHDLVASSGSCARLPGEGVFLTSQLVAPEDLGWTRMWWKVQEEMRRAEAGADPAVVKRDWCVWFDTSRPVFIEKSVSDATRIGWLDGAFPQAKFISLMRNGYAVAEGIRRRAGAGPYRLPPGMSHYPIEWCAEQWVASARLVDEGLASIDPARVLRLTYEEICADPSGCLTRTGAFLGLPDLDRLDVAFLRNRNPEALSRLTEEDIERLNAIASEELARHGYELMGRAARGTA
jgi:sulfotransferase family protein